MVYSEKTTIFCTAREREKVISAGWEVNMRRRIQSEMSGKILEVSYVSYAVEFSCVVLWLLVRLCERLVTLIGLELMIN